MWLSTLLAPAASADDSAIHSLGSPAQLANGDIVQAWTITDLKPSTDAIPYPVTGTLWEATATDTAVRGTVQPVVSNLNARARSGQTYRVLFGVATPQGVNPAPLAEGQQTTGKVYFDVTGDTPDSVLYNAGGPDLAVWVQQSSNSPRPTPYDPGSPTRSSSAGGAPAAAAEATPTAPAPGAAAAATPASTGTPGSQGTPITQGSSGTPVAPGSQGTPIPGSAGTPAATPPPGTEAGSEPATVAPAGTPGASPTGSSGTPAAGGSSAAGQAPLTAPSTTITAPPASEQR
ncbi:MPT63 family protein [Mycolicibacterium chlorophenolicum]|nr:MPT63 family protein [Mycolicibacterium chlorophenolicum]